MPRTHVICNKEDDINIIKTDIALIKQSSKNDSEQLKELHDAILGDQGLKNTVIQWRGAIGVWNYLFPAGIIISTIVTFAIARMF